MMLYVVNKFVKIFLNWFYIFSHFLWKNRLLYKYSDFLRYMNFLIKFSIKFSRDNVKLFASFQICH